MRSRSSLHSLLNGPIRSQLHCSIRLWFAHTHTPPRSPSLSLSRCSAGHCSRRCRAGLSPAARPPPARVGAPGGVVHDARTGWSVGVPPVVRRGASGVASSSTSETQSREKSSRPSNEKPAPRSGRQASSRLLTSVLALGLAPRLAQAAACGRGAELGRCSLDGRCLIATHGLARTALVVCSTRRSSFVTRSMGRNDSSEIARGVAMLTTGPLSVGRRTTQGLAEGGGRWRIPFGL